MLGLGRIYTTKETSSSHFGNHIADGLANYKSELGAQSRKHMVRNC